MPKSIDHILLSMARMMVKTESSLFNTSDALIRFLKKKAENFPLICLLYIPIIEVHSKKYPDFDDFNDWLLVPYYNWIFNSAKIKKYGESPRDGLVRHEKQLEKIKYAIGDEEFKKMQHDLLNDSMHPAVNGVHRKILDFYAELKAMEYYINKGYSVRRIPKTTVKMPDFIAFDETYSIEVEVKLIHSSNPIKDYIMRYVGYLLGLPDTPLDIVEHFDMRPGKSFSYREIQGDFKQEEYNRLKKNIDSIVENNVDTKKFKLNRLSSTEITYQKKDEIDSFPVTIDSQVSFCIEQLISFLNDYVLRRHEQAKAKFTERKKDSCVYLCIQLDEGLNLPYEEFDEPRRKAIEDFLREQLINERIDLILDFGKNVHEFRAED